MNFFMDTIKPSVVMIFFSGVVIYAFLMLLYVIGRFGVTPLKPVVDMFESRPSYMFGLPISAATSFAIVCVLYDIGSGDQRTDKLSFEFFGASFTGPAAPATLWLVCYLAIVASMKMVGNGNARAGDGNPATPGKSE